MNLKRYKGSDDPDGDFVLWEDHARYMHRNARLEEEIEALKAQVAAANTRAELAMASARTDWDALAEQADKLCSSLSGDLYRAVEERDLRSLCRCLGELRAVLESMEGA